MVQFKKLLPSVLRNTKWGDLASVVQNETSALRTDVYNHIYDRYTSDKSTTDELVMVGKMLGWNILSFPNTYTATLEYLRREANSIVKRINSKNAKNSYLYTSYIYGMFSEVYPMMCTSTGQLSGKLTTLDDPETQLAYAVLSTDREGDNLYYLAPVDGWTLDSVKFKMDDNTSLDYSIAIYGEPKSTGMNEAFTDTEDAQETDAGSTSKNTQQLVTSVTRNVLYSYYHKYLETSNEWLSSYSLKALQNDIDQVHKATERVYYEPWLQLETSSVSGELSTSTHYNYDLSVSGSVNSVFKGASLLDAQYIQFGTGSWYTSISGIPSGITSTHTPSYCIPSGIISGVTYCDMPSGVGGWSLYGDASSSHLDMDFIIPEFNKFSYFTELGVLDSNSVLIYYATFPKVHWANDMNNNIRVQINLV